MSEQKEIIPLEKEWNILGGWAVFDPVGSVYKDPDTKKSVTRDKNSFGFASKATQGKKINLGRAQIDFIIRFFKTQEGKDIYAVLPDVPVLEMDDTN